MKTIFKIAKTELQVLFYSPVAWLILIIFAFQNGLVFAQTFDSLVRIQKMHFDLHDPTYNTFASIFSGIFVKVQSYLYLYIPLLTMGIMSREYSSGSIKLLYSSPLTNLQIVLGKYLSLLLYGLVLMGVLGLYVGFTTYAIHQADVPFMLTGLLGLFLLLAAYASIGLFMSCITSYNVVAALGTLAIFAILNYMRDLWQDVAFVRDVTYWLALGGRSGTFIEGMITSEDFLYFFIVTTLFLAFTIIKLNSGRQKKSWIQTTGRYALFFAGAMLLGYFSALPQFKWYYDATANKRNTLTPASQEIMKKLDGDFTIHTYVNMLEQNYFIGMPSAYKGDVKSFEHYIRFKPEIKMKYYYYYQPVENPQLDRLYPKLNAEQRLDTLRKLSEWNFDIVPYDRVPKVADLSQEDFRFVRVLERANGKKTFLRVFNDMRRVPSEAEISAAIKRLVMELPVVGFLTGHGERGSASPYDKGYNMIAREKTFRYALINQGFDFTDLTLEKPIPDHIRILVIADPKKAFTPEEQANLQAYIDRGGNLLIAGEPDQQAVLNPLTASLGVQFLPGLLVKPSPQHQADLLLLKPTEAALQFSFYLEPMKNREEVITMPRAAGLTLTPTAGFKATTLFQTDSTGSWNELETDLVQEDSARLNPAAGEKEAIYPTVLALQRKVHGKDQKILVTGDADWLSNAELGIQRNNVPAANFSLINAAFFWMSDGEVPVDMRIPDSPDKSLRLTEGAWTFFGPAFKWGLSIVFLLTGVIIWLRRRGR